MKPANFLKCATAAFTLAVSAFAGPAARAADPTPVRILMNWFAQADQAGYWQTQIDNLGASDGIKVTVMPGGPKIQTIPQVAAGQAEFGLGNADDLMLARLHGAPVKAVYNALDYVPYDLIYHPDPAVKKITDLKGKTFAVSLGFAYWEWIKKQYGLGAVHEIPISGDLTIFKNDPNMVQQGYSIFLPYRADALGIPNAQFKVADLGYRPYDTMFTTDEMIQKHPDTVKAAIKAVRQGWANFIADPSKSKALILGMNSQVPADVHDKAVGEMISDLLQKDHSKLGCMSDARWAETANQLKEVDFLPKDFDVKTVYDRTLLPGC